MFWARPEPATSKTIVLVAKKMFWARSEPAYISGPVPKLFGTYVHKIKIKLFCVHIVLERGGEGGGGHAMSCPNLFY